MSETGSNHERAAVRDPALERESSVSSSPSQPAKFVPPADDEPTVISSKPPLPSPGRGDSLIEVSGGLVGERLEHFELQQFVGGGGMGVVFRALDTRLNRIVALKILARDPSKDEETVRRFRNEAQSAARLDHENVARVFYVGEDRGLNYIVFEFIEGVNVRDIVLERGPLPLGEALSYTLQVARALEHASDRNVVHRDIKPSNVLITAQGRGKLVDMGLARLHQVEQTNDLTASGVTLGTFDYISPEQARDPRDADVRSDIYSLGCTLFFMLTGRPPFPNGNALQKLLQHQGDAPPDPRDFNPTIPDEVARILRKTLAKDPRRRYPTPTALISDLLAVCKHLGLATPGDNHTAPAPPSPLLALTRRHLPWLAPLLILIAAVVILDVRWAGTRHVISPQLPLTSAPRPEPPGGPGEPRPKPPGAAVEPEAGVQSPGESPARPEALPTEAPLPVVSMAALANNASRASEPEELWPETDNPSGGVLVAPVAGSLSSASAPESAESPDDGDTQLSLATEPSALELREDPPAVVAPAGLLVVDPSTDGATQRVYASLKAACDAAQSGDVIELRYSGRRVEQPIRLKNIDLTIRAGAASRPEGIGQVYRPVVVFSPNEFPLETVNSTRSMISVSGGRLTLLNVAVELDLPFIPSSDGGWTLFQLRRCDVSLTKCVLTISDQDSGLQEQAAFFSVKDSAFAGMKIMSDNMPPRELEPTRIVLADCTARGEADFLQTADSQPTTLTWNNGLLTTTGYLLRATGGQIAASGARLEITLDHVTANTSVSGLCLIKRSEDFPHLLFTDLKCRNSILRGSPDTPFIEHVGVENADSVNNLFAWSGTRNHYEGYQTFWKINELGAQLEPVTLQFREWNSKWENQENQSGPPRPAGWKTTPSARNRPAHAQTPGDFALGESSPARGAAGDQGDIGLRAVDLPSSPPEFPAPTPPIAAP